jgi:citrate lyase subunit beta/citryl-CoA lyase
MAETTPKAVRPVRSLLFVPGNRSDWLAKALHSGADGIIIDLEDALPPGGAVDTRVAVRRFIEGVPPDGPVLLARVRPPGASMDSDIRAVLCARLDGIMLPKVSDAGQVRRADAVMAGCETQLGLEQGSRLLTPLLETANALRTCFELATASGRAAYMGAGVSRGGDIARALGYQWTPEGLETLAFRSHALIELRAAGVPNLVSGVWGELTNLEGLRHFAAQTRRIGYDGMMVIHPSHVPIVNDVFTPSDEQVAEWEAVIEALDDGHRRGRGATTVNGEMVDLAHVTTAREGLARARARTARVQESRHLGPA